MEDKFDELYDLITVMHSDVTQQIKGLSEEQQQFSKKLNRIEIILENDIKGDIKALYDGYSLTYEKLVTVENKVDDMASRLDSQEVEIKVIKCSK